MAKNYSIAEAVQVIAENGDNEALIDLGKRYPLLTQKIARVAVKAGDDFVDLMSFFPEYLSANKVNSAIKKQLEAADDTDVDEDDAEDEDEEKPVKKAATKKAAPKKAAKKVADEEDEDDDDAEAGSYDYDSMNNAKMYKLLGEMGKRKDCKEKYGDLSHDSMLKYLKKYGPKADASGEADDEDAEDEATDDGYEGKSAVELYKLCKQRKIKAEQKKPAKYYIGLLKKADEEAAAEAEAEDAEEDEEWDDEEEEAPKKAAKKAPAKKAAAKPAKKAAKKSEPEEDDDADDDDDDEWEI